MSSWTRKHRPDKFEDVIGQVLAKKILTAVVKKTDRASRSLILHGPWGTGKTTLARIFGKALSCENFKKLGRICDECDHCKNFDKVSSRYIEYDSSMVGNVQQVKDLKPVFEQWTDHFRVIVFDEAHLISRAAQSALLKVVEEGPENTFFVFVTTEFDKVLRTIISRSTPVELFKVDQGTVVGHLQGLWDIEMPDTEVEKDILEKVAFKANGHVRDAVMLLGDYALTMDEAILNVPINDIAKFFYFMAQGKDEIALKQVDTLMKYPLIQIKRGINFVIMRMMKEYVLREGGDYKRITDITKDKTIKLFKLVSDLWVQGVYEDKYLTYSFFLTVLRLFGGKK